MSGGSLDLARKAKRWDEKQLSNLKQSKEKISDELREAMKKSRKESELNTVESQIKGLEVRLKYSITDKEKTVMHLLSYLFLVFILLNNTSDFLLPRQPRKS